MEDFRQISRIVEIHGRRGRLPEDLDAPAPAALQSQLNLRRVLLSLTVVVLGMAAWWGM